MKRWILTIVVALGLLLPFFERPAAAQINILVDASRDGGGWWFPQAEPYFDPNLPHQGKALADFLRGQGMAVTELPRPSTITCEQLSQYDLVVAVEGGPGPYSASELSAYSGYVSNGGRLILLNDHKSVFDVDSLSSALGLDFGGSLVGVITTFTAHPITMGVSALSYPGGSIVTTAPSSATMLGFVSGLPVMGIMPFELGQVFFLGDMNLLEGVPQPLVNNLFGYMLAGARPVNACVQNSQITLSTNATVFHAGSPHTLSVAASSTVTVTGDVYFVVRTPSGQLFSLTAAGLASGLAPFLEGVTLPAGFTYPTQAIFSIELPPIPFGTYIWFGGITAPGTLNLVSNLAQVEWTFAVLPPPPP